MQLQRRIVTFVSRTNNREEENNEGWTRTKLAVDLETRTLRFQIIKLA